jgi:acetylornithine aminotransferase
MASLQASAGCHAGPARAPARRFRLPVRRLAVQATAAPAASLAHETGSAHYTKQVVEEEAKYVLQTYGRPSDIVFVKGQGSKLYDANGKEYLDFAAGIAVNVLGHSDPRWYAALADQAGRLAHTSNLYHTAPQVGGGGAAAAAPMVMQAAA